MIQSLVTSARDARKATIRLVAIVVAVALLPFAAIAETHRGDGYVIDVDAPPARAGATARATIRIVPTDGWKLNLEYPFKIELTPKAGVKTPKMVLRRDDARRFAESGAAIDVPFTIERPGTGEIGVLIKFATCDDATCTPQKHALTVSAVAK